MKYTPGLVMVAPVNLMVMNQRGILCHHVFVEQARD
jgi:hypothetical protein